ncbi:type II toxin-antitoxin system RelE/ParE family toxin [Glutamicibacter sp. M10]|uniref:type II toxin-antitoxin system RelE family toxin n=1 Tax=Glutamicibacter sp. M10 TaxID=3023076 RepID=UPI0021C90DC7|nr:type II toxin-antitoxin system RelE/ParE family toxin [Glutamicibacter sp. M10]UXN32666.1 type II toxin-antitoxin system RelE/ParE family toxin [Glutamicibacter sp. M10]
MNQPQERLCIVRLTEDAVSDLHRLHKKDPQIVRAVFKKILLLEKSPEAGEPLLGALVGFRKLVVGDRDWRIVWRITEDASGMPFLDISEIWAVGARSDGEVYDELTSRVARLGNSPKIRPLKDVIIQMGRLYDSVEATAEPDHTSALPEWMISALKDQLHLSDQEISELSEQQGQELLMAYWSRASEN